MKIKNLMLVTLLAIGISSTAQAQDNGAPGCNWGELTMAAIMDGFPQGPHASDPSGDGKGKGDSDQPRAGLGNVVEKGNLQATCEFIRAALGG
jgi:hypothetical protein